MSAPEYLLCLECETPNYVFEWRGDAVVEIVCESCGNEDRTLFVTEDEFEGLMHG